MKKLYLDLNNFLNKFYYNYQINNLITNFTILNKFKKVYGLNFYGCKQICFYFGFRYNIKVDFLTIRDLTNIYLFLKNNFNFFLFDLKLKNVKRIKFLKTYKGWRHIFNLPVRGQRSHTNAKTRKRFKIY